MARIGLPEVPNQLVTRTGLEPTVLRVGEAPRDGPTGDWRAGRGNRAQFMEKGIDEDPASCQGPSSGAICNREPVVGAWVWGSCWAGGRAPVELTPLAEVLGSRYPAGETLTTELPLSPLQVPRGSQRK